MKFESRRLQVAEVGISTATIRQLRYTMAFHTGHIFTINMLVMLTREVAIILRRGLLMTGGTLGVDIKRTGCPVGRSLTTVAAEVGAGAAVECRCAAIFIAEAGRKTDFSVAVIMVCATVTGVTAWAGRTEAQYIML
jgi:hypothetical protein